MKNLLMDFWWAALGLAWALSLLVLWLRSRLKSLEFVALGLLVSWILGGVFGGIAFTLLSTTLGMRAENVVVFLTIFAGLISLLVPVTSIATKSKHYCRWRE